MMEISIYWELIPPDKYRLCYERFGVNKIIVKLVAKQNERFKAVSMCL